MFDLLQRLLRRYWLATTVLFFVGLMSYTSLPVASADATPTPEVETVPPLEILLTPTNTPFPTPTSANNPDASQPTPTATKRPANPAGGDNAAGSAGQPAPPPATGGAATDTTPGVTSNNTGSVFSGVVAVTLLELRKTPDINSRIVDTAFNNDPITILGRTSDGSWWLICCGANQRQGWAPPQVIRPNFALTTANALLPVVISNTTGMTPTTALGAGGGAKGAVLQLIMRPQPAFVWQGQQFELQLVVTNQGDAPATNVQLRNDLPVLLRYRSATINQQGLIRRQTGAQGNTIFTIEWPSLAPGAKATATVTLQVAPDTPAGALIDNLALVTAPNAANAVAGITLAMPPTLAPQFR